MVKISVIRGTVCCWNRKWTMEVNTASAYNTDRGSIITYNEPASLVKLTYNGEGYLAVSINNTSSLNSFSFTGYAQNDSLKLVYDDNVSNVKPFTKMINSYGKNLVAVKANGSVGIGVTDTKGYKLAVAGNMTAEKVKLQASWPDYLFAEDYKLPSLSEVAKYAKGYKHLPGISKVEEVENKGLDIGEMNRKLLEKVEEMMLYIVELENQIAVLEKGIKSHNASNK